MNVKYIHQIFFSLLNDLNLVSIFLYIHIVIYVQIYPEGNFVQYALLNPSSDCDFASDSATLI